MSYLLAQDWFIHNSSRFEKQNGGYDIELMAIELEGDMLIPYPIAETLCKDFISIFKETY